MRLARYMSLTLVKLAVTATLVLAFVAEILDLVENAGDILDQGEGARGLLRYVVYKMPTLCAHALPIGALIGALITLLLLARNSETVAMRAAGRSTWSLFACMVPGALALVVMHATLLDMVAPRTEALLALWLSQRYDDAEKDPAEAKPVFLRVGDSIVSFDRASSKGRKLRNVRIYDRNPDKVVTARTSAAQARYENGGWTLTDAERVSWERESLNQRTPANGPWKTTMKPEDALAALTPEGRISLTAARAVLAGEQAPNAPISFYETLVERIYAGPLGAIVMVLLAMPASLVNWRDARSGRHAMFALGAGLSFLLVDGLLATLAIAGMIGPVIGAWSGLVIFALIGAWRIRRIDRGWPAPAAPLAAPGRFAEARG